MYIYSTKESFVCYILANYKILFKYVNKIKECFMSHFHLFSFLNILFYFSKKSLVLIQEKYIQIAQNVFIPNYLKSFAWLQVFLLLNRIRSINKFISK